MPEERTTPTPLPEIPTSWEKYTVLMVFSILMLYMGYIGNTEAMTAFGVAISTYFLSRSGV